MIYFEETYTKKKEKKNNYKKKNSLGNTKTKVKRKYSL